MNNCSSVLCNELLTGSKYLEKTVFCDETTVTERRSKAAYRVWHSAAIWSSASAAKLRRSTKLLWSSCNGCATPSLSCLPTHAATKRTPQGICKMTYLQTSSVDVSTRPWTYIARSSSIVGRLWLARGSWCVFMSAAVIPFSEVTNKSCRDAVMLLIFSFIMQMNTFLGDLTNISGLSTRPWIYIPPPSSTAGQCFLFKT